MLHIWYRAPLKTETGVFDGGYCSFGECEGLWFEIHTINRRAVHSKGVFYLCSDTMPDDQYRINCFLFELFSR
jgi:hypothetical protein